MARYVIDAPTLLHLVDAGLRIDPGHQLVAPNSIRSEALELLLREVLAGKRAEEAALKAHERLTELKMRLLGDRVSRRTAWQIAREHGWDTLRDAEYLAVTRLQADALVTVDPGFAATARSIVTVAAIDHLLAPASTRPAGSSPALAAPAVGPGRGTASACHDAQQTLRDARARIRARDG
jgi:predicted nucleic acid-binding protein